MPWWHHLAGQLLRHMSFATEFGHVMRQFHHPQVMAQRQQSPNWLHLGVEPPPLLLLLLLPPARPAHDPSQYSLFMPISHRCLGRGTSSGRTRPGTPCAWLEWQLAPTVDWEATTGCIVTAPCPSTPGCWPTSLTVGASAPHGETSTSSKSSHRPGGSHVERATAQGP